MSNTKNAILPGWIENLREFIVISACPRVHRIIRQPATVSGYPSFQSVPSVVPMAYAAVGLDMICSVFTVLFLRKDRGDWRCGQIEL